MGFQMTSAIVTACSQLVAKGRACENLDYTFTSFADKNPGIPLHAFIIGDHLPERQLPQITYHLVKPIPDFSHPLREVYFRRMELIDELGVDYALVVDSMDCLCLRELPPFSDLGPWTGACIEHNGSRVLSGQYTSTFVNCGVIFWNVSTSRNVRKRVTERGRRYFRTIADDQLCFNELAIAYTDTISSLFNYRAQLYKPYRGIPAVQHLDGVFIYHNARCIDEAKKLKPKPWAELPELPRDNGPLNRWQQWVRRVRNRI